MERNFSFTNKEIIILLKEVLAAMEVKDVNKFRIRAYQNVISTIESLSQAVQDLWMQNKIMEIPGVGAALKQHFDELFTNGFVKEFDEARKDLPQGMFSLIGLRGIGAKKAFKLAHAFNLTVRDSALQKLLEAAETGKIRNLEGFGEKSEKDILEAITELKTHKTGKERMLLSWAEEVSTRIINYLKESPYVIEAETLGSLRRRAPTIGDLDIAVATNNAVEAISHFLKYTEISEVMTKGEKGARIVLSTDLQVDLRVITPESFGSMLQYFTGSKMHNVLLRTYSLEKGLSLSEYGIKTDGEIKKFATEQDFYTYLGLQYIPPEVRQGKNEVELAAAQQLPALVKLTDIKGDLHTHTVASDGVNTLEEMVLSAKDLGYEYLGISDHSPSVQSRGENEVLNIINTRRKEIEQYMYTKYNITLLYGYEVNILTNATLALPDEFLTMLDYVIASIHTSFDQPKEQLTDRLLSAIENPYVTVIGHPTNRLINQRPACEIDWSTIFSAIKKKNKILEINSQPNRLDLTEDLVYEARKIGIKFIVNTDAHATTQMKTMKYGIDVARRGWCTKSDILNTLPRDEFLKLFKSK